MYKCLSTLLLLIVVYNCVVSGDISENASMSYLKHFGFMKNENDSMKDGIERFQRYAGLFVTGKMDEDTQKAMETPRCGSEEPEELPPDTLKGAFQGSRWKNISISYIVLDYPSYLEKKQVDDVFLKAFNEWALHIGRSFRQVKYPEEALLSITFTYIPNMSNITDMDSKEILAAARYPIYGGDIRFSSLRNWTTDPNDSTRTSLYHVALHEIGHALGLLHSSYPNSIMSPYFMRKEDVQLHNSDIQRVGFLYNTNAPIGIQPKPNTTNDTSHRWDVPSLCKLSKFDAIIAISDSEIYVFNDHEFWLLEGWTEEIRFSGDYPRNISRTWKELPSKIDAAYVHPGEEIYFFRGSQCWKYRDTTKLVDGYPRSVSAEFPGVPDDIDAAMTWQDNHTYFFQGSQYWRYDKNQKTAILEGFPKPISAWGDIPNDLNAVLHLNFDTYFFKDTAYYKHEPVIWPNAAKFPRPTAFWWFLC